MAEEYILVFRVENKVTKERILDMTQTQIDCQSREHVETAFLIANRRCWLAMEERGILPKYDSVGEVETFFFEPKEA